MLSVSDLRITYRGIQGTVEALDVRGRADADGKQACIAQTTADHLVDVGFIADTAIGDEHHLAPPSGGHADLPPSVSARLLVLDVLQDMKREQDVVGAEGLTVRPLHALPHIERVAQVVRGHAPARREDADDVLLGVDRGQALVDHAVDVARALVGLEQGVEHRRLADQRLDCRAALCGLRHRRDRLASGDCQHRREGGGREATRDALPPRRWRPSRPGMRPR